MAKLAQLQGRWIVYLNKLWTRTGCAACSVDGRHSYDEQKSPHIKILGIVCFLGSARWSQTRNGNLRNLLITRIGGFGI